VQRSGLSGLPIKKREVLGCDYTERLQCSYVAEWQIDDEIGNRFLRASSSVDLIAEQERGKKVLKTSQ
jgi:hypothetical protein